MFDYKEREKQKGDKDRLIICDVMELCLTRQKQNN